MIHKLKTLGLALVAILALNALVASAAQATQTDAAGTIESGSGFIDGTDENPDGQLTRNGRTITCTHAHYKSNTVTSGATSVVLTPEYTGCSTALGPATVTMNGCNYEFTFKADTEDTFTAVTHLRCPAGKVIEVHGYSSAANHTAGTSTCTYHFGEQTNKTTIDLTNKAAGVDGTPKDWVTADLAVTGIVSKRTSGSALLCGSEIDNAGNLHGQVELTGTNHAEQPTGITISTHS